jgi:hypothetical protein
VSGRRRPCERGRTQCVRSTAHVRMRPDAMCRVTDSLRRRTYAICRANVPRATTTVRNVSGDGLTGDGDRTQCVGATSHVDGDRMQCVGPPSLDVRSPARIRRPAAHARRSPTPAGLPAPHRSGGPTPCVGCGSQPHPTQVANARATVLGDRAFHILTALAARRP